MKWIDKLLHEDTECALHAQKNGQAKLEILYYGEKGRVRRRLVSSAQSVFDYIDTLSNTLPTHTYIED